MSDAPTHPLAAFIETEAAVSELANKVGCSIHHLRNLRDGRKTASLPLAKRLSDATGIPMDAFVAADAEAARQ